MKNNNHYVLIDLSIQAKYSNQLLDIDIDFAICYTQTSVINYANFVNALTGLI